MLGLALATLLLPALSLPASPLLQGVVAGLAMALAATATWFRHKAIFVHAAARQLRRLLHLYLALILLILLADVLLIQLS
jgi:hypothetical protein